MEYKLHYSDDEVKQYHPIVEETIKKTIEQLGKSDIVEVIHHPEIPGLTIVPDFALRLRKSGRYIFILEVKKTPREVNSQRYWHQARSYTHDLSHYWEPNHSKYFCVTNIEMMVTFADREGPINTCVLSGIYRQVLFDKKTKDANDAVDNFGKNLTDILSKVLNNNPPKWADDWTPVINSFESNYTTLIRQLGKNDYIIRDATLYEFLRLLFYCYLKEFYALEKNSNNSYFKNISFSTYTKDEYVKSINNYFTNVLRLDFKQVFADFPDDQNRIFPERISDDYIQNFHNFISLLNKHITEAIKQNNSPQYLFNLLTSRIYKKEELHNKGKIMTDNELAGFLAGLTIEQGDVQVIDPCSGDGALLDAAYDVLQESLSKQLQNNDIHQHVLNHLHGIEIDPFLAQMAAFRLLSKNFNSITPDTFVDIKVSDTFSTPNKEKYDVLLMNPPFLRNDDENAPIENKDEMLLAIEKQGIANFVDQAAQPNLYFYFVNYAWHYLKDNGRAGIIIMAKFLNNKDGLYLKKFLIDKIESIILYPRTYFKDFKVTTVIVILSNNKTPSNKVSFLRIINPELLSSHSFIKAELKKAQDKIMADYTLKTIKRTELNPQDNWRLFLLDPKGHFNQFQNLSLLTDIKDKFYVMTRGQADNSGGSKIIYFESPTNPLANFINDVEPECRTFGLQNNKVSHGRRKFLLTQNSFNQQNAIYLGEEINLLHYKGLSKYMAEANKVLGNTLDKVIKNVQRSTVIPKIIIPRADREKHSIYLNTTDKKIVVSTNFFYLDQYKNTNDHIDELTQLKFITAYLLSSFGQLQFEINGNNQEGLRKLEGFMISKFKILDPNNVNKDQIDKVVREFENLNDLDIDFSGNEGVNGVRRGLDMAIGSILYQEGKFEFSTLDDFVDYFELFLFDLVDSRKH